SDQSEYPGLLLQRDRGLCANCVRTTDPSALIRDDRFFGVYARRVAAWAVSRDRGTARNIWAPLASSGDSRVSDNQADLISMRQLRVARAAAQLARLLHKSVSDGICGWCRISPTKAGPLETLWSHFDADGLDPDLLDPDDA